MKEIKKFIKENLLTGSGKIDSNKIQEKWFRKNGFGFEYNKICESYADCSSITQKIYNIMNDKNTPLCKYCNINKVKFKNFQSGYFDYCSCKCSSNSKEKQEKIMLTNISKYGESHPAKNTSIKKKTIETNIKKYGFSTPLKAEKVKEKIKDSIIQKYGVENINQKHIQLDTLSKIGDKEWLIEQHHNQKKSLEEISKELGVTRRTILNYLIKNGVEAKRFSVSNGEKELCEFLSQYFTIETCNRKILSPQELDIYIPEKKIAIEYNGLYWHSENKKGKLYHYEKTERCKQKGVQLIHIFEDEWRDKREIVKSILISKLGVCERKIYARNCVVKKVNNKSVRQFVENNHLQGNAKCESYYCLYHNNELVSVASVGRNRYMKNEFELIRYCSKLNTIIVGGFGKLLKEIKKDYNKFYSYADLRYFNGNVYSKFGVLIKTTEPGYFWTDSVNRISRYKTQKHKLHKLLENEYDENLSENQNMIKFGYDKIYDCGHNLYLL